MKALRQLFTWGTGLRAVLGAAVLLAGTLAAGEPGSDLRAVSRQVNATLVPPGQELMGLPRVPNMLDLIDLVAQNPEVINEANRLGLKVMDGTADVLDAIQDSKPFKIFNVGADGIGQLSDFIEKALKNGEKLTDYLSKHADKIQNYAKKLKILDYALKAIKIAHLSGHVLEALWNQDRARFSDSVNELVKGTLKMGAGMGGAAAGTAIGTAIGGLFGGVGAIPGAVIGGVIGAWICSEAAEGGTEWGYDNWVKDWMKDGANGVFDWLFGPPQQAPPLLPPPLPGAGGSGQGGSSGPGRTAPKLNRFR